MTGQHRWRHEESDEAGPAQRANKSVLDLPSESPTSDNDGQADQHVEGEVGVVHCI